MPLQEGFGWPDYKNIDPQQAYNQEMQNQWVNSCQATTEATLKDVDDFMLGMAGKTNSAIEAFKAAPVDPNNYGLVRLKEQLLWRLEMFKEVQAGMVLNIHQWIVSQATNGYPVCSSR